MKALRQIVAVTWMNLCSVPKRVGSSLVIVIGIGGVVAVMVGVLAMAAGIIQTLNRATRPERVVVMRGGAASEGTSFLGDYAVRSIADSEQVQRDTDNAPLASFEILRPVRVVRGGNGSETIAILRGVGAKWQRIRPEIKIVAGRAFRPAVTEVLVGKALAARFEDLQIGEHIVSAGVTWDIVGVFTSNGDAHESEIIADSATVMSAYQRFGYSSVTVSLKSPQLLDDFERILSANPKLNVSVSREADYYERQSHTMTTLISAVAYGIGAIMGVGALFAALNTMYSAVSARSREIATLRALGYSPIPMVISVLVEAMLLALAGGLVGVAAAWWFVRGTTASTVVGDWGTQFVFGIAVTPPIMVAGLTWATALGLIGGLFPAVRAARLPVATALRAL